MGLSHPSEKSLTVRQRVHAVLRCSVSKTALRGTLSVSTYSVWATCRSADEASLLARSFLTVVLGRGVSAGALEEDAIGGLAVAAAIFAARSSRART